MIRKIFHAFLFGLMAVMFLSCVGKEEPTNGSEEPGNGTEEPTNTIPNNEIWYSTNSGNKISSVDESLQAQNDFGAELIKHTYEDGLGKLFFDKAVTSIPARLFSGVGLKSVTLPNTIKSIGEEAFKGAYCDTIVLPKALERIENKAFYYSEIKTIKIPDNVSFVGEAILGKCFYLKSIEGKYSSTDGRCLVIDGVLNSFAPGDLNEYVIPDGISIIGNESMNGYFSRITIPGSVKTIGKNAFNGYCLTSVSFSEGLEEIKEQAFVNLNAEEVTIPSSVRVIESGAFADPKGVKRFKGKFATEDGQCLVVDGVLVAFACLGLDSYVTPEGIRVIGERVVENKSLKELTISEGVEEIHYLVCNGLNKITLPQSLKKITATPYNFQIKNVHEVVFPAKLEQVPFPLSGNTNIYHLRPTVPPVMVHNVTGGNYKAGVKIYVPEESLEAYKTADYWKAYTNELQAEK